jgi:hypothetical protein
MLILNEDQKNNFLATLEKHAETLAISGLQIVPIQFKNGWMLPEDILQDERFSECKKELTELFSQITVREISEDEIIIPEDQKTITTGK